MADIDYQVEVTVYHRGIPVDSHVIDDEDYQWAMWRLRDWAIDSAEGKDF